MKPYTIAFLYNVRHTYPDPNDARAQLETDFDDPATIEAICTHFRNCGYNLIPIEANQEAYMKLYNNRDTIDLAFNYSEGMYGVDRELHMSAILEMLQIPYLGAGPLTRGIAYNKARAKDILLAHGVSTLPYQLFKTSTETIKKGLTYPLIVKPVAQGSSAGITNKSVAHDEKELRQQVKWVLDTFHEPALVEPFLKGREFSIGMLGNPPIIFPIIEPDHKMLPKGYNKLDSLEVKWVFEEEIDGEKYLMCPAPLDKALEQKIQQLCRDTWNALEVVDWCRIDIRCDENNVPYVLEVNIPAGLIPPEITATSYYPFAARKIGIEYEELLKKLVDSALKRYGKTT